MNWVELAYLLASELPHFRETSCSVLTGNFCQLNNNQLVSENDGFNLYSICVR
jgi:hypothetical protein